MKPFLKQQAAQDCLCCSGLTAKDINNFISVEQRKNSRENRLFRRQVGLKKGRLKKAKSWEMLTGKTLKRRRRKKGWMTCMLWTEWMCNICSHSPFGGICAAVPGKELRIRIDEPCQSFMMPNLFSAFQHLLILFKTLPRCFWIFMTINIRNYWRTHSSIRQQSQIK